MINVEKENISEMIDENKDMLDDRIVSLDESKKEGASNITYRIANLRLTELITAFLTKANNVCSESSIESVTPNGTLI